MPSNGFDADLLKGDLNVRPAKDGETLEALNDKSYTLSEGMTAVCSSVSGCGTDGDGDAIEMGDATNFRTPRRYELGFRFEF